MSYYYVIITTLCTINYIQYVNYHYYKYYYNFNNLAKLGMKCPDFLDLKNDGKQSMYYITTRLLLQLSCETFSKTVLLVTMIKSN